MRTSQPGNWDDFDLGGGTVVKIRIQDIGRLVMRHQI